MKITTILIVLAVALLIDYAQARFVYHDTRCMVAHCRIQKQ